MTEGHTWTYEPDPDEPGVPYTIEHSDLAGTIDYVDRPLAFESFKSLQITTVTRRPRWQRIRDEVVWRTHHAVAALRGSSDECEP